MFSLRSQITPDVKNAYLRYTLQATELRKLSYIAKTRFLTKNKHYTVVSSR